MSNEHHHLAPKLTLLEAKCIAASQAHEEAERMAERARALDDALELEAAEHGIEFEEIVRAAMASSQAVVH